MPKPSINPLINQQICTIIACALACEAKPFIDFFKLKKDAAIHPFSVYRNGSVSVIVSGMGQNNMAAAINWLSGFLNAKQTQFWINVGVAGHQTAEIGDLFCVHKVSDYHNTIYPTKWLKHKTNLAPLITINHEETCYPENTLYDMEGFAFYQAATRFNSQEQVQCLKIVSDNKQHAVNRDKNFVSQLITQQRDDIISFINLHVQALEKINEGDNSFLALQKKLLGSIHFSHSQQLQLSKLCQSAQSHQLDLNTINFKQADQAKQVLLLLKHHIDQYAVTL